MRLFDFCRSFNLLYASYEFQSKMETVNLTIKRSCYACHAVFNEFGRVAVSIF